jgi:hypothetical protein
MFRFRECFIFKDRARTRKDPAVTAEEDNASELNHIRSVSFKPQRRAIGGPFAELGLFSR